MADARIVKLIASPLAAGAFSRMIDLVMGKPSKGSAGRHADQRFGGTR